MLSAECGCWMLNDPPAAHDVLSFVENSRLSWSNRALGLIEGNIDLVVSGLLRRGKRRLVTVANFGGDSHGLIEISGRNQVDAARAQTGRMQLIARTNHNLLFVSTNFENI